MNPKVSVIMPARNGKKFIAGSINSILRQSFKDFELIVVNDCSTDGTETIIKSFDDKRIISLNNAVNSGVSKTRNIGIRHAKGKYIAYCDQDDLWFPNHLGAMISFLKKNGFGLVFARYYICNSRRAFLFPPKAPSLNGTLEVNNFIGAPLNVMHRKSCLKKTGLFDESACVRKHSCEDWDMWLRISDYYQCGYINKTLSKYVFHESNRCYKANYLNSYEYVIGKRIRTYTQKRALEYYVSRFAITIINTLTFGKSVNAGKRMLLRLFSRRGGISSDQHNINACRAITYIAESRYKEARDLLIKSITAGYSDKEGLLASNKDSEIYRYSKDILLLNLAKSLAGLDGVRNFSTVHEKYIKLAKISLKS